MWKEGIIREQITALDNGKISRLQVFEIAAEAVTSSQTYVMILRWDVETNKEKILEPVNLHVISIPWVKLMDCALK